MAESQFPALSLDNNPWMKYFSPTSGHHHDVAELSAKTRVAPSTASTSVATMSANVPAPHAPQVVRTSSGKLMRHTSAPNRLSTPPNSPDRSSNGDNRRGKAEAPTADSSAPPSIQTAAAPAPRLQKKPSNPLLAKQKLFKSTQSAPNLTAALREVHNADSGARSIESELSQQSLYKTELCRSYEETGVCRYGAKCQFAHGKAELRPIVRHPKYKTEICKTWQAHGSCPYGARCRFIHAEEQQVAPTPSPTPPLPAVTVVNAPAQAPAPVTVDPPRTPVAPSASSVNPPPRLAVFADIIGESSAQ